MNLISLPRGLVVAGERPAPPGLRVLVNDEQRLIRLTTPGSGGSNWLSLVSIAGRDNNQAALSKMDSFLASGSFKGGPYKSSSLLGRFFFEEKLGIGTMQPLHEGECELGLRQVGVAEVEFFTGLPASRHRPGNVGGGRPFVENYPHLISGSPAAKTLVVYHEPKMKTVAVVLLAGLGVWLLVGTVVGVTEKSLAVGAQVTGLGIGISGLLMSLATLAFKK